MRIHVTGSNGFIGKVLVETLARAGNDMVGELDQASVVVHLAGIAHRSASRDEYHAVNVELPQRLARSAASHGTRFVFMSSVKVHGEQSATPLTESSLVAPVGDYAESKARAEDSLRAIPNLRLAILRPPLVYGPGVKANFLALMRAVARRWPLPFAALENRRSLIYVGNLVDAIIRCLDAEGTFLVSDGEAVSTPRLCREIGEALGRPARLFPFPPVFLPRKLTASLEVDDLAIRRALGWRPPFTRRAGLLATADWYLSR